MEIQLINCAKCKTANRANANFCKNCGSIVATSCPNCNYLVQANANFCDNCQLPFIVLENNHPIAPNKIQDARRSKTIINQNLHNYPVDQENGVEPNIPQSIQPSQKGKKDLGQLIPAELRKKLNSAREQNEMVGERRIVTMLFCDIKGSTQAAEQLDPEEWAEIMNEAFEFMISPIYKYEGTVARLMGDAILAFFGAPIAHEDDPSRAILAGLDIVEVFSPYLEKVKNQWGIDVDVRVGINTGMVMVGQVGSDLQMEYSAMGDAINLAARMEQTAKPGTIQVSEHTYKNIKSEFDFEDLGYLEVKGKSEPIKIYQPLRRKSLSQKQNNKIAATSLIGRESEWKRLQDAGKSVTKGVGQIVYISGDAGLGKTRLIQELKNDWLLKFPKENENRKNVALESKSNWIEISALSYETSKPYGVFQRLMRRELKFDRNWSLEKIDQHFSACVSKFPSIEEKVVTKVLESLIGLETEDSGELLEGEEFREGLFELLTAYWSSKSHENPLVIVIDDLHWADPASVDLLAHLFKISTQNPIMFICSTRPERKSPGWGLRQAAEENYSHKLTQINIRPLSDSDCTQLIQQLLNIGELPEKAINRILEKTDGNPFFVEEIVKSLIEINSKNGNSNKTKVNLLNNGNIDIPDNIHSLLTAKIDRLEESERQTLQLAALIGRSFYFRILQSLYAEKDTGMLDNHIATFQHMDLIKEATRHPEVEFSFRQALTQEAAYSTILLKKRKMFHRQVAEVIEVLYVDQAEDMKATLAHHYGKAHDFEKGFHYSVEAGNQAFRMFAMNEVIQHYSSAIKYLEKIETSHQQQEHLFTKLGRAYEINSNFKAALQTYEKMEKFAKKINSKKLILSALIAQSTIFSTVNNLHDVDKALNLSKEALILAQGLKDQKTEVKILWNRLNALRFSNRIDEAVEMGEKGLKLARKLNLPYENAMLANDLPHVLINYGQSDRARKILLEATSLWREQNNLPMLTDSLSTLALFHSYIGEFDKSLAFSKEAREISESINNNWGIAYSQMGVTEIHWQMGEMGLMEKSLNRMTKYGDLAGFSLAGAWANSFWSLVYSSFGLVEDGIIQAQTANDFFVNSAPTWAYIGSSLLSYAYVKSGNIKKAKEFIEISKTQTSISHANFAGRFFMEKSKFLIEISKEKYADASQIAKTLIEEIKKTDHLIYYPEALILLACSQIFEGMLAEAIGNLDVAENELIKRNAIWLLWQIYYYKGLIKEKQGDNHEMQKLHKKSMDIILLMSEKIPDKQLKKSFLAMPRVLEIKKSISTLEK